MKPMYKFRHETSSHLINTGPVLMQYTPQETDTIIPVVPYYVRCKLTCFDTIYLDFPEPKPLVSSTKVNGHMAPLYRAWYASHLVQNITMLCVFCQ